MGSEAACAIRIDGKSARGTARLEHTRESERVSST